MDVQPNYKQGLKVASNAYDAVNKDSGGLLTSTEWFDFTPTGIFDTYEGKWVEFKPEDFNNIDEMKKYLDDSRYSVALGSDMNNIDGFMKVSDFIKESGIEISDGLDTVRREQNGALERENNSSSDTSHVHFYQSKDSNGYNKTMAMLSEADDETREAMKGVSSLSYWK